MTAKLRSYTDKPGFTEDYHRVRDFLIRINQQHVINPGFVWGRWEWEFSLSYLDTASLSRMGIWEDGGKIVALATYQSTLGWAYFSVDRDYEYLKPELLLYAKGYMVKDGSIMALLNDTDRPFQQFAFTQGFRPTQHKEQTAVLDITDETTRYTLPKGYSVTSLANTFDMHKYNRVLWKGFNHEAEGLAPVDDNWIEDRRISVSGPHVNLNLNIAVVAPDGEFVSYCGMWYEPGTDYALVEPVATDPKYRKLGLGRAAVLEGVKRCGKLGAKQAIVGSSQQFYYSIGFYPLCNETFWEYRG